jgi:lysyl-tRNA synthetase class 2
MEINFDKDRIRKLEEIKRLGLDPFGEKFEYTADNKEIVDHFDQYNGKEVRAKGRVMNFRDHGKIKFLDLQDESGIIQAYIDESKLDELSKKLIDLVERGDIIGVIGIATRTKRGTPSVLANQIKILAKCLLPFPSTWYGIADEDERNRKRYLDFIFNRDAFEKVKKASIMLAKVREYMNSLGYLEIQTPILQPLYGGANAKPFITHYNALDTDYYLRISPELYLKRLLVGGFEKVYEIAKDFRNEGIDTRHSPEFTMMEAYKAYGDLDDMKTLVKGLLQHIAKELNNSLIIEFQDMKIDLSEFEEMTMEEAVDKFTGKKGDKVIELARELGANPKSYGEALNFVFEEKVEKNLIKPTFITKYPVEVSPLTKRDPNDPNFVQRFELYVGRMEVANAYTELNDPIDQLQRFKEEEKNRRKGNEEAHPLDYDFVEALGYGMPPAGGIGIGLDRIAMILTNARSVREIISFPQLRRKENS